MSDDLIALTAAQAAERIRDGEIEAAELFEAYRSRAAADSLEAWNTEPWDEAAVRYRACAWAR